MTIRYRFILIWNIIIHATFSLKCERVYTFTTIYCFVKVCSRMLISRPHRIILSSYTRRIVPYAGAHIHHNNDRHCLWYILLISNYPRGQLDYKCIIYYFSIRCFKLMSSISVYVCMLDDNFSCSLQKVAVLFSPCGYVVVRWWHYCPGRHLP